MRQLGEGRSARPGPGAESQGRPEPRPRDHPTLQQAGSPPPSDPVKAGPSLWSGRRTGAKSICVRNYPFRLFSGQEKTSLGKPGPARRPRPTHLRAFFPGQAREPLFPGGPGGPRVATLAHRTRLSRGTLRGKSASATHISKRHARKQPSLPKPRTAGAVEAEARCAPTSPTPSLLLPVKTQKEESRTDGVDVTGSWSVSGAGSPHTRCPRPRAQWVNVSFAATRGGSSPVSAKPSVPAASRPQWERRWRGAAQAGGADQSPGREAWAAAGTPGSREDRAPWGPARLAQPQLPAGRLRPHGLLSTASPLAHLAPVRSSARNANEPVGRRTPQELH